MLLTNGFLMISTGAITWEWQQKEKKMYQLILHQWKPRLLCHFHVVSWEVSVKRTSVWTCCSLTSVQLSSLSSSTSSLQNPWIINIKYNMKKLNCSVYYDRFFNSSQGTSNILFQKKASVRLNPLNLLERSILLLAGLSRYGLCVVTLESKRRHDARRITHFVHQFS